MVQRIYGLSGSGMDVDAMVKKLMDAERTPYNQLLQKKTQLEYKKAAYNSMYTLVNSFRNTVSNNKLSASLMPKTATSSNSTAVSATANADAVVTDHAITVDQLAAGVKKTSTAAITTGANKDTIQSQFGLATADKFNLTIANGTSTATIQVDPSKSIYELVSSINNAGINVKANYDSTLDRFFLSTANSGSGASLDFSANNATALSFLQDNLKLNTAATARASSGAITTGTAYNAGSPPTLAQQFSGLAGSFTIQLTNGAQVNTVNIDTAVDTMDTLVSKLSAAGVNISASYNASADRFSLTTTNSGAATGIDFTGSDAAAMSFLKDTLKLNTTTLSQNGVDAVFDLDGVGNLSQASNSFTISGVAYKLQALGSANVTVGADIDKTVSSVKALIDAYNDTISKIQAKIDEPLYSDYLPLTDDQKTDMKDSDITAWNTKAQSGMLRHDTTLTNLITSMRRAMSSPVAGLTGKYNSAASLGITTGSYLENGKLYLDENKLRDALQADPEAVNKVFGTNTNKTGSDANGVVFRLYDTLTSSIDTLVTTAGVSSTATYGDNSNLAKRINDYTDRMTAMSERLEDIQDRYYRQFDAMETAISRLNQQSAWLAQQFSTGK